MFAARYWPSRYFSARYWPKVGAQPVVPVSLPRPGAWKPVPVIRVFKYTGEVYLTIEASAKVDFFAVRTVVRCDSQVSLQMLPRGRARVGESSERKLLLREDEEILLLLGDDSWLSSVCRGEQGASP